MSENQRLMKQSSTLEALVLQSVHRSTVYSSWCMHPCLLFSFLSFVSLWYGVEGAPLMHYDDRNSPLTLALNKHTPECQRLLATFMKHYEDRSEDHEIMTFILPEALCQQVSNGYTAYGTGDYRLQMDNLIFKIVSDPDEESFNAMMANVLKYFGHELTEELPDLSLVRELYRRNQQEVTVDLVDQPSATTIFITSLAQSLNFHIRLHWIAANEFARLCTANGWAIAVDPLSLPFYMLLMFTRLNLNYSDVFLRFMSDLSSSGQATKTNLMAIFSRKPLYMNERPPTSNADLDAMIVSRMLNLFNNFKK